MVARHNGPRPPIGVIPLATPGMRLWTTPYERTSPAVRVTVLERPLTTPTGSQHAATDAIGLCSSGYPTEPGLGLTGLPAR